MFKKIVASAVLALAFGAQAHAAERTFNCSGLTYGAWPDNNPALIGKIPMRTVTSASLLVVRSHFEELGRGPEEVLVASITIEGKNYRSNLVAAPPNGDFVTLGKSGESVTMTMSLGKADDLFPGGWFLIVRPDLSALAPESYRAPCTLVGAP